MPTDPAELVEQLWQQFQPLVHERVRQIEAAARGTGDVDAAARAAHNLAGALGSYGRTTASDAAREIDLAFSRAEPGTRPDPRWLLSMVQRLKTALAAGPDRGPCGGPGGPEGRARPSPP